MGRADALVLLMHVAAVAGVSLPPCYFVVFVLFAAEECKGVTPTGGSTWRFNCC
jgi:hypothetical protein